MNFILKFLVLGVVFLSASCSYLPEEDVDEFPFIGISEYEQIETPDFIQLRKTFVPTSIANNHFIFYPGGLVDPHAYIELGRYMLLDHTTVTILKVDANLAVLEAQKAATINISSNNNTPQAENRVIVAGHSLGGSMACAYVKEVGQEVDLLILMASYPAESADINQYEGTVLSITAENDGVLDLNTFEEAKQFLPQELVYDPADNLAADQFKNKTIYKDLEGANHASFGSYGSQNGDGESTRVKEDVFLEMSSFLSQVYNDLGW